MFGVEPIVFIFMALAMTAVGGIAYVILFPKIEQERNTERRVNMVQREIVVDNGIKLRKSVVAGATGNDAGKRRKTVEASMKEADKKRLNRDQYMKKPPLAVQMKQAGMSGNLRTFYMYSLITGAILTGIALFLGVKALYAPAVFLVGAFGLPRWYVARRRKKRVKAFLTEFPNSLDVLVRAVKSGLPLNDGVRLLAAEAQEPVRTEFQRIVDSQSVGKSIPRSGIFWDCYSNSSAGRWQSVRSSGQFV
jgi:tight adherence protein B